MQGNIDLPGRNSAMYALCASRQRIVQLPIGRKRSSCSDDRAPLPQVCLSASAKPSAKEIALRALLLEMLSAAAGAPIGSCSEVAQTCKSSISNIGIMSSASKVEYLRVVNDDNSQGHCIEERFNLQGCPSGRHSHSQPLHTCTSLCRSE